MNARAVLSNAAGELSSAVIPLKTDGLIDIDDFAEACTDWVLSPGDTITIEEVQ